MFGNDGNNQSDQTQDAPAVTPAYPASAPTVDGAADISAATSLPAVPTPPTEEQLAAATPAAPAPTDDNAQLDQLAASDNHDDTPPTDLPSPTHDDETPATPAAGSDDLLALKSEALQQLSPLVGHLEQTPEEKFKTTMMMIQAADNKDLIKVAYEAAQAITDEKVKAQALLDVINEINYFTQQAHEA